MKRITIWHRQLSSQCFSFLQVVCAGGFIWESPPSTACGHRGQKGMHPDKCVQKVTLRHLFLNSLTLAAERGKKARCGTHCWQPLRGVSMKQMRAHTQIKKGIPVTPLPVLLWWCEGGIAAWGAPLESGTDGRKETTHWSRVTTFCLFFPFYAEYMWRHLCSSCIHLWILLCVCVCSSNYFQRICNRWPESDL